MVIDVKTPRGRWDKNGKWELVPVAEGEDEFAVLRKDISEIQQASEEKAHLPSDLKGKYRFGITEEELDLAGASPKLRSILSFQNATQKEISTYRKQEIVKKYGRKPRDTGYAAVEMAMLTMKIRHMQSVMRVRTTDKKMKRAMQMKVLLRRKRMKYLKKKDPESYYKVLRDMDVRDIEFI